MAITQTTNAKNNAKAAELALAAIRRVHFLRSGELVNFLHP
jgi:hypothetical protein